MSIMLPREMASTTGARREAERLSRLFVHAPSGCWVWTGYIGRAGYGHVWFRGQSAVQAHRAIWRCLVGELSEVLTLDHLCRVRRCVNPMHLDPVPSRTNTLRGTGPAAKNARKTHCPQGHLLAEANLYLTPRGTRQCRECNKGHCARYRQRRQSVA